MYITTGKKQKNLNTKVIQQKKKWFDRIFILKRRGPLQYFIIYSGHNIAHYHYCKKEKRKSVLD